MQPQIRNFTQMSNLYLKWVRACMCVCVHVCVCVCLRACAYSACMPVCVYACVRVCVCVRARVECVYACVCRGWSGTWRGFIFFKLLHLTLMNTLDTGVHRLIHDGDFNVLQFVVSLYTHTHTHTHMILYDIIHVYIYIRTYIHTYIYTYNM